MNISFLHTINDNNNNNNKSIEHVSNYRGRHRNKTPFDINK